MKKVFLTIVFMLVYVGIANAEAWQQNYGYWENKNEISAKKDLIGSISPNNIFDFNTSPNAGGEKIKDGKYYVPIMYNGGYNGTDTDYIYVDELKGVDGKDGKDGLNGTNGTTGINGADGKDGQAGEKGETGDAGVKGDKGDEGKEGKKGEQGIQGPQGKGLEDRYEVIGEVRVLDTKKTTTSIYAGRDINNDNNIFGVKFTYKLGRSYYERKIDEIEARLNKTEYKEPEVKVDTFIDAQGQTVVRTHF